MFSGSGAHLATVVPALGERAVSCRLTWDHMSAQQAAVYAQQPALVKHPTPHARYLYVVTNQTLARIKLKLLHLHL
jgi:hypothetical protein